MKKALLSLAACAMLASSADAEMYLVGDPVSGGWNPANGIEMAEVDGGYKWTGTVGVNQWFAFATQLEENGDWNVFNSTYRLNPAANGTVAADGEYTLELGGADRAFKGNGAEVTYFIKETAGVYTLTVTEVTDMPLPDHSLFMIGQTVGEWSPMVGKELEKIPGGWKISCHAAESDYFAFATQLLDTPDWVTFNANYRVSPDADGVMASDGVYEMHVGEPQGSFRGVGTDATYIIRETEGGYSLSVSGAPAPVKHTWSVIGSFNGWEADFPMTEIRDGVWKATMYDFSGEFKFRADNDWELNLGASEEWLALIEGDGDYSAAPNGYNFNIPEEVEEVIFELDVNNNVLNVSGLTPTMLALRGDMNDWNFEWSYLFTEIDDNVFMLYLDGLEKDWVFKVSDQDWYEEYTTGITNMTSGEMYDLLPGAGLGDMGVDNNYTEVSMFFSLEDYLFWFVGEVTSGVASAEIASGTARYFNLQGSEVQNPAVGLYIRVINGKSEKIIVK